MPGIELRLHIHSLVNLQFISIDERIMMEGPSEVKGRKRTKRVSQYVAEKRI